MSGYNSTNTYVLATHEQAGGNTRMLLLHICDSGRHEYVIGSYFHVYKEYMAHWPDYDSPAVIADRDGNCFTEDTHEEVGMANGKWSESFDKGGKYHYEWDWGHYFGGEDGLLEAVDYWRREVLWREAELFELHDGAELDGCTLQVVYTNDLWSAQMHDKNGLPMTYSVSGFKTKEDLLEAFSRHRPQCALESMGAFER